MRKSLIALTAMLGAGVLSNGLQAADQIIHDGEYYFLKAQHGEEWAKEDEEIDAKLASISTVPGSANNRPD